MWPNQIQRSAARWLLAATSLIGMAGAHATVVGAHGALSGGTRSFEMFAAEGYINAADGVQIYSWGYGATEASGGTGLMQYSGPTLLVNQGETVNITFTNHLPVITSMMFPAQSGVVACVGSIPCGNASAGAPAEGVLAGEAAPEQTVTYTFVASMPGTYLYQSGTRPGLQNEMGLVGAIVVYPTGAGVPTSGNTKWAYNHVGTAYERETLLVASDMDSKIHGAIDEQLRALRSNPNRPCLVAGTCRLDADMAHRFPDYWFLNGRTSPDVFARNYDPSNPGELVHQPYNALPRLHPGERILLRMVGGGSDLHPMHHHGNNSWAVARDGRMLSSDPATRGPNLAFSDYTIKVVPGQTEDAIWTWSGAGLGWDVYGKQCGGAGQPTCASLYPPGSPQAHQLAADRGKPIPTKLPSEFELSYGEFYSGSPYLGDFGLRPVGAGFANTTGAFFHMFHSHNEREVVNGGVYPGGMMTMMVVEPFTVTIETTQP